MDKNGDVIDNWHLNIEPLGQILTVTSSTRTPPALYTKKKPTHVQLKAMLTHKITCERQGFSDILCCAFSDRLLAVGYSGRVVRLFSIEKRDKQQRVFEVSQSPLCAHAYAVNALAFSASGSHLVTVSQDGTAAMWDTRTGTVQCCFRHDSGAALRCCALSSDGRLLLTGSDDETACLWRADNMIFVKSLPSNEATTMAVAFSPDSRCILTADTNGNIRFWHANYGHAPYHIVTEAHDLGVTCAQFAPVFNEVDDIDKSKAGTSRRTSSSDSHSYTLATGGMDDTVKIWQVTEHNARILHTLTSHEGNVMCLAYSRGADLLASGAGDRTVIVWETDNYTKLTVISHHQRYVTCVSFSDDATLLATGSNDKTLAIWRLIKPGETVDEAEFNGVINNTQLSDNAAIIEVATPVYLWTVDDVIDWLRANEMQVHEKLFRKRAIDGKLLLQLDDKTLCKSLSVESLAQRQQVLKLIDRLRDDAELMRRHMTGAQHDEVVTGAVVKRLSHWPPDELLCPITKEIMRDPVIAADGYSYERTALAAWFESGHRTSPMTNAPLKSADIIPNRALRLLIHTLTQARQQM